MAWVIVSRNCVERRNRRRCDAHSSFLTQNRVASGLFFEPTGGRLSLALRRLVSRNGPNRIFCRPSVSYFPYCSFLTLRHMHPFSLRTEYVSFVFRLHLTRMESSDTSDAIEDRTLHGGSHISADDGQRPRPASVARGMEVLAAPTRCRWRQPDRGRLTTTA